MPRAETTTAKAFSDGNLCGWFVVWSDMSLTSKKKRHLECGHPETPEVDFSAHPACIKTHPAPSIPPVGHLNITQSYLVFHNCAWMSITPVKTRQSHSQRTFCPARFFSNEESIFLVSHGNSIRQRIHPATAHSGPSYPDEHVIFVPKYSPSTLLLEMILYNSLLPKVEMKKITQSRYGYQKQGRQQKQSASNRNNMNSYKPHFIY